MKIGVTAPGSSTNFFVKSLMARPGLKPTDVSIIGVGAGPSAVAAMKKGEIDAISNLDPVITKLEQDGDIVVLPTRRTEEGNTSCSAATIRRRCVYLKADFIEKNPGTVQALVNAFYKTLKWLEKATPEEIAAAVPEEYYLGDKALYMRRVEASRRCIRDRHHPAGGHEERARHAGAVRRGDEGRQGRPVEDLRRPLREKAAAGAD